jgi:hypothetical protein
MTGSDCIIDCSSYLPEVHMLLQTVIFEVVIGWEGFYLLFHRSVQVTLET